MAELPEFQKKQMAFAAHIRDPKNVPAPDGIEDRRMAIYRELFFNNLKSLLSNMFPVLKQLHSDDKWRQFVREFMKAHRAQTPYFLQLPSEFLAFLQNEYELREDDFPFLLELAHYEYVELALSIAEDQNDVSNVDPDGDLLQNVPIKSVLTWVYAYRFPVHRISADYQPPEPSEQPVFIAVYRQPNDKVGFLELNRVTAGLLEAIENNETKASGEQLLRKLGADINYPDIDALLQHGAAALQEMRNLNILIGTRTPG